MIATRRRLLMLPLILSAGLLWGCPSETLQVAVVLPLSGELESYGESSRRGIELAMEDLQAVGLSRPIELLIEDSGSDPATAVQVLEDLYSQGALAAIGGLSTGEAAAMVEVAEARERVLISPSSMSERLSREARHFYRLAPSDHIAGNAMADFLGRNNKSIETVSVLAEDSLFLEGFDEGFRPTFEDRGGTVLEALVISEDADERSSQVRRVVAAKPDAVYLAGHGPRVSELIESLRGNSYRGQLLATQTFASPSSIQTLGKKAVGVLLTHSAFGPETNSDEAKEFSRKFQEKYGEEPDVFAAEAYDALRVLALAMEGRPPVASEIRRGLRDEVKDYPGVTGTLEFNEAGAVTKYPRVYRIADTLMLEDENKRLDREREELEERRRKLEEELRNLQNEARQIGS